MACIYLSDGEPESEDYETNYFYYNGSDQKMVTQVNNVLEESDFDDPLVRNKLYKLCELGETYECDSSINVFGIQWFKSLIKRVC